MPSYLTALQYIRIVYVALIMTQTLDLLQPFSLTNQFLIAMPGMRDPFFSGSVVYLCEHSEKGAMGIVINKPAPMTMDLMFDAAQTPTPIRFHGARVMMGGPIRPNRGFVVHTPVGSWESSMLVTDDIAMTASQDIITGLSASENDVDKALATVGYSCWAAGQLEKELAANDWLTAPADTHILFDVPYEQRYQAAMKSLKIDRLQLNGQVGHA